MALFTEAIGDVYVRLLSHQGIASVWPIYTGTSIPIDDWRARMWLDTWVELDGRLTWARQAAVPSRSLVVVSGCRELPSDGPETARRWLCNSLTAASARRLRTLGSRGRLLMEGHLRVAGSVRRPS
jgi:hypothetical protein